MTGPKDKRYGINGRSRGLIAIPSGDVPTGLRCVQIQIPDSDAAVRQLMGMLYELTHWQNFDREGDHKGTQWAQAWRAAIVESVPIAECGGPLIQFRACSGPSCGLEYSTDGGDTWSCIDLAPCIETIWDEKLAQAFDDGVLGRGTTTQNPQDAPAANTCVTYHGKLSPGSKWISPSPVSSGDQITITGTWGGWSIGEIRWWCADGNRYLLGHCQEGTYENDEGDLLASRPHMSLIGLLNGSYFSAFDTPFLVPAGTSPQEFYLVANTGLTGVPSGEIEFDVEVCSAGWCYEFDFTTGAHGWEIDGSYGTLDSSGFHSACPDVCALILKTSFTSAHITAFEVFYSNSGFPGGGANHYYNLKNGSSVAATKGMPTADGTHDWIDSWSATGDNIEWNLWGTVNVTKIRLFGSGDCPFGTPNC